MSKMKFKHLVLMDAAIEAAMKERQRQNELYGVQRRPWGQWLAIWGEEIGETHQAIQPLLGIETTKETDASDFGKELIHAIAVGLAMYEQLLEQQETTREKSSECCFCDSDNKIVWEDVDGKKVCSVCYERESDTGEVY